VLLHIIISHVFGQKILNDEEIKKRRYLQNAQHIGLVDTVFVELVSDKSFTEIRNFLVSNSIRLDQNYKEKAARQIHNTSGSKFCTTYHSSCSCQNILSTSYRRNTKVQSEQKSYRGFRRIDSSKIIYRLTINAI
jgi:hypothetical protein